MSLFDFLRTEKEVYKVGIRTYSKNDKFLSIPNGCYYPINFCVNDTIKHLLNNHILVGGTTGAGKSNTMNYLLCSLSSMQDSEIILIDNKNTSFKWFRSTPICKKYAVTIEDSYNVLVDCMELIKKRYTSFENDIFSESYDGKKLFVFIDELADLLTQHKKRFLPILQNILQIGRGARVFLVCGTQIFTKDLLGSLVNNFTARVGLKTLKASDSRTLLYKDGCENLNIGDSIILYNSFYYREKIPLIDRSIKEKILLGFGVRI